MVTIAVSKFKAIEPSLRNAFPHYLPLAVYPLILAAAANGGWWLTGPFVFFMIVGPLDLVFGLDERNMDPKTTTEQRLLWYSLPVWVWAVLWPVTFVYTIWQIFMVGNLAWWEGVLLAMVLAIEGQAIFIVGHELIHRRTKWERYIGEFLLASGSYPHYATEHFYIHHAFVGTPLDVGSAPKGQSFWRYFPRELASNIVGAWRVVRKRMARRQLPIWHISNPFWRYGIETGICYAFVWWLGGWWAALIYMMLCLAMVFSMKISNYIQHYGLRRIRLPNGRFEKVLPRHAWATDYKFSNWMFYKMQRHPDHHVIPSRRYPLLQHHGPDESPQLPGSYGKMFNLVLNPKRWFATMDPLVDQWRAQFYPEIEDWSAYDSPVSEARPEAFDAIVDIYSTAPRLVRIIEQTPELLDSLLDREFTDLEISGRFGPDAEFEKVARRGLVRVYWTFELGVEKMQEQLTEFPAKDAEDAAEIARDWSNDKVFQIAMHTIRGNLAPTEAGIALANVAEASVTAVLQAVMEDSADRQPQLNEGGMAAIVLGDLASKEVAPSTPLEMLFIYDGPAANFELLGHHFYEALGILTQGSLLFVPMAKNVTNQAACNLADFIDRNSTREFTGDILNLTRARCIFTCGDASIKQHFDDARHSILTDSSARDALLKQLHEDPASAVDAEASFMTHMDRGLEDVERAARILQLTHITKLPESLTTGDAASIFREARAEGLISSETAEYLTDAAKMWRSLRGIQRLIMEDGTTIATLTEKAKTTLATSCDDLADFDALMTAVHKTAAATRSGLKAVLTQDR